MGRPSQPLVSKLRAAKAALEVIDEHGLSSLTLAATAKRMGVSAPAFYHHFKDKDALLAEVAWSLLDDNTPAHRVSKIWEEQFISAAIATRRSILKHPNAAILLLQFFPRHLFLPGYNRWVKSCPLPPRYHMTILEGAEKLTFGSVLFEASATSSGKSPTPDFDGDKLPALYQAMKKSPYEGERLFEETLRVFFLGAYARANRFTSKQLSKKDT